MKHGCEICISKSKGFFCGLDPEILEKVDTHKVNRTYRKGEILYNDGASVEGVYCIQSGKIKIMRLNEMGKEAIFKIVSTGDLLGHYKLFDQTASYKFTAVALEASRVCFLDKKFILEHVENYPSLALKLIKKISQDSQTTEFKFTSLLHKNVRERLAELLFAFAQSYGVMEEDRIRLDIRLTREELSSMIGTVNETVTRFMTEFKNEGIIEEEERNIYITDREKLMLFANIKDGNEHIYKTFRA